VPLEKHGMCHSVTFLPLLCALDAGTPHEQLHMYCLKHKTNSMPQTRIKAAFKNMNNLSIACTSVWVKTED
jgi:hypothetical protein